MAGHPTRQHHRDRVTRGHPDSENYGGNAYPPEVSAAQGAPDGDPVPVRFTPNAERAYLAQYQRWREEDRGYGAIQSTRPQTVSYGLNDSPAGLAAWVVEKWRAWADSAGDLDATFSRGFLHHRILHAGLR
jgi:hypothetical protein